MPVSSVTVIQYAVRGIPGLYVDIEITCDVNNQHYAVVPAIKEIVAQGEDRKAVVSNIQEVVEYYFQQMHTLFFNLDKVAKVIENIENIQKLS